MNKYSVSERRSPRPSGYVLDLFAMSPYYCGALVRALQDEGFPVNLLSVTPRHDPMYFRRISVDNSRGIVDLTTRLGLEHDRVRRVVRLVEYLLNWVILALRWCFRRPGFVHIQWLPLLERSGTSIELIFLRLLRRLQIPLVYTVHNVVPHEREDTPSGTRTALELADRLICHTETSRDVLVNEYRVPPRKIRVIPHGTLSFDASKGDHESASDDDFVLFAGNIRPYKGVDLLLEAWPHVLEKVPAARLVIAGSGDSSYLREVEAAAARLPERSLRLLLGFVPSSEMAQLHRNATFVVFPYRRITQSGALLTAIAYGKPVVATRIPGFVETLEESEHALFSDPGDAEGLAQAMVTLLEDRPLRAKIASAVERLRDTRFSWQPIARATADTYASAGARSGITVRG